MLSDGLSNMAQAFLPFTGGGVSLSVEEVRDLVETLHFASAEAANMEFRLKVFGRHQPIIPVVAPKIGGSR